MYTKGCYFYSLQLIYVDRVMCEELPNLSRDRPVVTNVDSEDCRILEEYEIELGGFGKLALKGEELWDCLPM